VEEDTLSSYPITIEQTSINLNSLIGTSMGLHDSIHNGSGIEKEPDRIYSNNIMERVLNTMITETTTNDLANFKYFIENTDKNENGSKSISALSNDIKYSYSTTMNIYKSDTSADIVQVNPSSLMRNMGVRGMGGMMGGMAGMDVWQELLANQAVLTSQFDVIAGKMPEKYNEIVLIVDENNEITDFTLYSIGLKDSAGLAEALASQRSDEKITIDDEQTSYTFEEILSLNFKLFLNSYFF
jgi:putative ABC transport system permease protein